MEVTVSNETKTINYHCFKGTLSHLLHPLEKSLVYTSLTQVWDSVHGLDPPDKQHHLSEFDIKKQSNNQNVPARKVSELFMENMIYRGDACHFANRCVRK
jgi:hypothetical protein